MLFSPLNAAVVINDCWVHGLGNICFYFLFFLFLFFLFMHVT